MNLLLLLITFISAAVAEWNHLVIDYPVPEKTKFSANWESLDKRKLPRWYDQAKIGIMIHWGVYSVPAFGPESAVETKNLMKNWNEGNFEIIDYMQAVYGNNVTYEYLAELFDASKFDPYEWVGIFGNAGAKYIILTAKNSDGFTLFPSTHSPKWNSMDIGPRKDLVGELRRAVIEGGLKFGVYYSLLEWPNPSHLKDIAEERLPDETQNINYKEKVLLELQQLVENYGPTVLWADNDEPLTETYMNVTEFIAWLYNESPVADSIVINDRWTEERQKHGDFFTYPLSFYVSESENNIYRPVLLETKADTLKEHKWEQQISIDKHALGYRKVPDGTFNIIKSKDLIENVVTTVSCGGNILINLGVTHEGLIPWRFQEPLKDLGQWLDVNGEAIYGTSPWQKQKEKDGKTWYTCRTDKYDGNYPTAPAWQPDISETYAIFFEWPENHVLFLKEVSHLLRKGIYQIELLGMPDPTTIEWEIMDRVAAIKLPEKFGQFAWTLKFTKIRCRHYLKKYTTVRYCAVSLLFVCFCLATTDQRREAIHSSRELGKEERKQDERKEITAVDVTPTGNGVLFAGSLRD